MKEFCYNCDKITEMEEIEEVFDEETSVTNKAFKCKICGNSYLYIEEYEKAYSKMEKRKQNR
jgi:hypothetical protein